MSLAYSVEAWRYVRGQVAPLWREHYEEIAHDKDRIPLDPDWMAYDGLSERGFLHIVTVRDGQTLVGYLFAIVGPHLHYRSTKVATFDLYWINPEYRKGWAGVKLFKFAEKTLRDAGVVKIAANTKLTKDMSLIFDRLGWTETERIWTKMVGE